MIHFLGNELNIVLEKLDLKAVLHDMQNKNLSSLDVLNKSSLVNLCKERDLPTAGSKDVLKNSLKDWMKKKGVRSLVSIYYSMVCIVKEMYRFYTQSH